MGLYKYSKKRHNKVIVQEKQFIFYLVIGSVLGSLSGSLFLNLFSSHSLRLILGIILLISSLKMLYINKKGGLILLKELF
ncbi:TSUP family transporter [Calditerrivibrio nitroreducens]